MKLTELRQETPRADETRRYSVWYGEDHIGYVALVDGKWDTIIPAHSTRRAAILKLKAVAL